MSYRRLCKSLLTLGLLFSWISPLLAQSNRLMLLNEEWDTYTQTSNRYVNGWNFCKNGINDQSIVQRGNLHAYLTTGSTESSGTTVATPWLPLVADTFSFYIYGSNLRGHTAQVEFGFIPDTATINDPSDICNLFIPYDTVTLSVSNQWQRTTRDMHPYYAIHGTTHRFAIRLINSYQQALYLDEIRAWIPSNSASSCPDITSAGRDFWATFLYNYHETYDYLNPGELRLTALSTQDCFLYIDNNTSGHLSTQLNTINNHFFEEVVGTNASLPVATVYDGGYHITSSEDIWLYATNFIQETQDVATIIPTSVLDTYYIVQDYPSWGYGAQVAFVATEDNTVLTMTVPCNIQGTSITAGTTLTPTLMRGQSYLLISDGNFSSFSGMEVRSNGKPFAMFQGGRRVKVPTHGSTSDFLFEQALPPSQWGNEFLVAGVTGASGNCHLRITSAENNCSVSINGTTVGNLNARQTYETTITSTTGMHIMTSKPCCVILYLASNTQAGHEGDPSTITIPPVDKGVCNSRFQTHHSAKIESDRHKVTIICNTAWSDYMMLDGNPLPNANSVIDGYKIYQITLPYSSATNGIHQVGNIRGPFIAYAYGLGYEWESYAFPLGFSFESITVEPQTHRDTTSFIDTICQGHAYNNNGFSIGENETQVATTLTRMDSTVVNDFNIYYRSLTLTVLPTFDTTVQLSLIPGDTIFFLGDTLTEVCNRTYPLQTIYGCDSLVHLILNYTGVSIISSSQGGCPGQPVTLTAEGSRTFYWSSIPYDPELDNLQGQNPIVVHPDVTTVYQLIDASGNIITSFTVSVAPPPTLCIETNRDFIDFDYPVITLHDCSPDRYSSTWIFSDGRTLNGERARRQFSRPLPDTVTVTLHACNQYGCCTDTTIGFAPKIRSVWFPNIFFPNQENNNVFGCYTSYEVAKFSLEIYNRWGLIVWRTTDIETPWDGTHKGKPVQQGAYVYKWFLEDIHGDRKTGTGTVTLIR